jgi:hypothetical protein
VWKQPKYDLGETILESGFDEIFHKLMQTSMTNSILTFKFEDKYCRFGHNQRKVLQIIWDSTRKNWLILYVYIFTLNGQNLWLYIFAGPTVSGLDTDN